ncbi:MAG TPA: c-type cytochrome [Usitatibacter sp.]|nr:c-type cytochrome [Usitatibacter sp.]
MHPALLALVAAAIAALPAAAAAQRSGEQVVRYQCALCHGPGVGGAPRIGDREAWDKRRGAGFESLVRSALDGRGAMPPNGGLADLSEAELRAAIAYMLQKSGASQD